MSDTASVDNGLLLAGLDGSNPLGFLAAIGTLRLLHLADKRTPVSMAWELLHGRWTPKINGAGTTPDELLDRLEAGIDVCDASPWSLHTKLPFKTEDFRKALSYHAGQALPANRDGVDILSALGVEVLSDDKGNFLDTALRMVRMGDSQGNGLLAYARRICEETSREDLQRALLQAWRYEDRRCALRWDPAEYHGYALQWSDPSKQSATSEQGANRLALAALPLLPTVPVGSRAVTTAFGRPGGKREYFTWPIWQVALPVQVVRSLLSLSVLQTVHPSTEELTSRGITAVFRSESLMTSKYYRNLSPAQRIT